LDIVPWISQSGQITAEITPNVSNSDKTNEDGYPNVSSRSITTTVRLNDGQTLALGGLIKNQESEYSYKVPFLGSIPIIGAFFRQSGKMRQKSNLVVFITPHIITENENIVLEKELEKYDLNDKSFIERGFYSVKKKLQSRAEEKDSAMSQQPDSSSEKAQVVKLPKDTSVTVVSRPQPKPEPSDSSVHKPVRRADRRNPMPEPGFSDSVDRQRKNHAETKQIKQIKPDSTGNQLKK